MFRFMMSRLNNSCMLEAFNRRTEIPYQSSEKLASIQGVTGVGTAPDLWAETSKQEQYRFKTE